MEDEGRSFDRYLKVEGWGSECRSAARSRDIPSPRIDIVKELS
jgi:hypothetical protein